MRAFRSANSTGMQDGYILFSGQLVTLYALRGRVGEVIDAIDEVLRVQPSVRAYAQALLAIALLQLDRTDEAARVLAEAMAERPDLGMEDFTSSVTTDLFAVVANRTGHRGFAEVLYRAASRAPDAVVIGGISCGGHLSTALGTLASTLGDRDAASRHFDHADGMLEAFRAPLLLANNRMEHGRALLELADPADRDRAEALLRLAVELYERHDCPVRVTECQACSTPSPEDGRGSRGHGTPLSLPRGRRVSGTARRGGVGAGLR